MRTTIDIIEPLLQRAKKYAAEHDIRLSDVVQDALLEKLTREANYVPPAEPFRMITYDGGLNGGVSILDALDEEFRDPKTGQLNIDKLK